jgi:site-specific recombinase XerD
MVATDENRRQAMQKGKIPLEKLAKHFETYNRSEGKSPKTVIWYSRILRYLGDYLKAQGLPDDLDHLKVDVVREFILHLQTKKKWDGHPGLNGGGHLRAISVQTYVRGVKGFFSWLQREGYTEENRLAHLKPPKAPKTLAEVLTDEEVRRILASLNPETPTGCRDRAVLITLLDTGLRLSEVAGIRMADVHIDEGYLKVMGKGAKERIVPMGGLAQKALLRYIHHFREEPLTFDDDRIFLTLEGRAMSGDAVQLMIKRLARKSGVERLHPHLCRHTFATNYLINGGDVFTLQQILGHTTLEMVRRYVNLASAHVMVQHRKFSPMDRMKLGTLSRGSAKRSVVERRRRAPGS